MKKLTKDSVVTLQDGTRKKVSSLYLVKVRVPGTPEFLAVTYAFSKDAKETLAEGFVPIEHVILPKAYRVEPKYLTEVDWAEHDDYVQAENKKAWELSTSLEGFVPGKLFSIGVADGSASYVVTKVNKKTCDVEWRGFCLDRYTCPILGWGGRFNIEHIRPYVNEEKGSLFPWVD